MEQVAAGRGERKPEEFREYTPPMPRSPSWVPKFEEEDL